MQSKRYDSIERQVVPAITGVNNRVIENTENHEVNYHGIRFKGRLILDAVQTGINFGSGYITLMCLPNDFITIPTIFADTDMIDAQSMIIACEPWAAIGGTTHDSDGSFVDFNITPKTSRNCATGAKIIGQVTNESPGIAAVLTALLSTFETSN